jgi:hypothetical protein
MVAEVLNYELHRKGVWEDVVKMKTIKSITYRFAYMFVMDNPRFDEDKFVGYVITRHDVEREVTNATTT